jgi:hypothetical protein
MNVRFLQRFLSLFRRQRLDAGPCAILAAATFAVSKLIQSILYRPFRFVAVACAFILVALAAGYFAALRTTRVDPTIALRSE